MSRPHETNADVQVLDEELVPYAGLPGAGDGILESQVESVCGPPHEQQFRRVLVPVELLPDDVGVEDLDAAVADGDPLAARERAAIDKHAESLRAGGDVGEIVVVITADGIGVLDGRHRVAAARIAGTATLRGFECHGPLRGFLFVDELDGSAP